MTISSDLTPISESIGQVFIDHFNVKEHALLIIIIKSSTFWIITGNDDTIKLDANILINEQSPCRSSQEHIVSVLIEMSCMRRYMLKLSGKSLNITLNFSLTLKGSDVQ